MIYKIRNQVFISIYKTICGKNILLIKGSFQTEVITAIAL